MTIIKRFPALFAGVIMAALTGGLSIADACGIPKPLSYAVGGTLAGINIAVGALIHAAVTPNSAVALTNDQADALKASLPPFPTTNPTIGA